MELMIQMDMGKLLEVIIISKGTDKMVTEDLAKFMKSKIIYIMVNWMDTIMDQELKLDQITNLSASLRMILGMEKEK